MDKSECTELFAFNDWANGRILDSLETLGDVEWTADVGGSFGSIRATTAHLVGAEWLWFQRWLGAAAGDSPAWLGSPSLAELRSELDDLASERRDWLDALPGRALSEELEFRLLSGSEARARLSVLLRHLVNHSTYHRGQLVVLLRNSGRTAPSTDFLSWDFERRGL